MTFISSQSVITALKDELQALDKKALYTPGVNILKHGACWQIYATMVQRH